MYRNTERFRRDVLKLKNYYACIAVPPPPAAAARIEDGAGLALAAAGTATAIAIAAGHCLRVSVFDPNQEVLEATAQASWMVDSERRGERAQGSTEPLIWLSVVTLSTCAEILYPVSSSDVHLKLF
jgi:hypothetical protein